MEEAKIIEEIVSKEEILKQKILERRKKFWMREIIQKCQHEKFKTISKKDKIIQCRKCKLKIDLKNEMVIYENENIGIGGIKIKSEIKEQDLYSVDTSVENVQSKREITDAERLQFLLSLFRKHIF